jgi:cytidine deaminase
MQSIDSSLYAVLKQAAVTSCLNAYTPYSNFQVGAAILSENDRIFSGSNVENASYGATMCAERCAIYKGVNEGFREVRILAVVTNHPNIKPFPCGMCLQVLSEFASGDCIILIATDPMFQHCITHTLDELFPKRFRLEKEKNE